MAGGGLAGRERNCGLVVYRRLRSDVLAGVFSAGELLYETGLTDRYGVSRTPLREALARLEQDGLLERASRGYRVRSGTPQDVLDIYQARTALESVAASNAAARRSALELARLAELTKAARQSTDPATERSHNAAWHELVWEAGHNPTVRDLLVRLTDQLRIYDGRREEQVSDLHATRDEHAAVLAAVRSGDGEAAARAMNGHLSRSRAVRMEAFVHAQTLPVGG